MRTTRGSVYRAWRRDIGEEEVDGGLPVCLRRPSPTRKTGVVFLRRRRGRRFRTLSRPFGPRRKSISDLGRPRRRDGTRVFATRDAVRRRGGDFSLAAAVVRRENPSAARIVRGAGCVSAERDREKLPSCDRRSVSASDLLGISETSRRENVGRPAVIRPVVARRRGSSAGRLPTGFRRETRTCEFYHGCFYHLRKL